MRSVFKLFVIAGRGRVIKNGMRVLPALRYAKTEKGRLFGGGLFRKGKKDEKTNWRLVVYL
jgi:hypothetical protein